MVLARQAGGSEKARKRFSRFAGARGRLGVPLPVRQVGNGAYGCLAVGPARRRVPGGLYPDGAGYPAFDTETTRLGN